MLLQVVESRLDLLGNCVPPVKGVAPPVHVMMARREGYVGRLCLLVLCRLLFLVMCLESGVADALSSRDFGLQTP